MAAERHSNYGEEPLLDADIISYCYDCSENGEAYGVTPREVIDEAERLYMAAEEKKREIANG
jgi:hypothetical protein